MNATTVNTMPNVTTSSNEAQQQQGELGEGEGAWWWGNQSLEAYTVVLSMTAHLTSMMFGGASSVAVVAALLTKSNINKYSYLLVLTLIVASCCVNFLYSPLEMCDLLTFHYLQRHPTPDFVATKTVIYIFLIALIHIVVILLTVEAIVRKANCFGQLLQRLWPLLASLFAVVWSLVLTGVLVSFVVGHADSPHYTYAISSRQSQFTYLSLIVTFFVSLIIALGVHLVQFFQSHVYCENWRPHYRHKKMSLALPEFLISQSHHDCEDTTTPCGYDNVRDVSTTSRSPSPSTPKLLTVSTPDTASVKGDEAMPASPRTPKSSGNRLGINMAQVLGRRRHTICQISDASTPTAPDPITKAKQYNYVRKFSVDISALQAQLQNPKIFKDAPFQSDMDLTRRTDAKPNDEPKPLQPLQPLNLKLDQKVQSPAIDSPTIKVETPQSAGLSIPPPVIMVSNDDVIPETERDDNHAYEEKEHANKHDDVFPDYNGIGKGDGNKDMNKLESNQHHQNHHDHEQSNSDNACDLGITAKNNGSRPDVPTTLPLKEHNQIEAIACVPTLESAITEPSDSDTDDEKLARLSVGLGLTFLVAMLFVLVAEALRHTVSAHSFLNISTCTVAISTLQTVVYPQIIACCDDVVHRAIRKLKNRVRRCFCRAELGAHSQNVEDSSSTSHV